MWRLEIKVLDKKEAGYVLSITLVFLLVLSISTLTVMKSNAINQNISVLHIEKQNLFYQNEKLLKQHEQILLKLGLNHQDLEGRLKDEGINILTVNKMVPPSYLVKNWDNTTLQKFITPEGESIIEFLGTELVVESLGLPSEESIETLIETKKETIGEELLHEEIIPNYFFRVTTLTIQGNSKSFLQSILKIKVPSPPKEQELERLSWWKVDTDD